MRQHRKKPDISVSQPAVLNVGRPTATGRGAHAVLVCHGMGQQLPFDTLHEVADAVLAGEEQQSYTVRARRVRLVRINGSEPERMVPRVELDLDLADATTREVHLYEAYWAPLTEGMITYRETAAFLVRSALSALRSPRKFGRWKFGAMQECHSPALFRLVIGALMLVLLPFLLLAYAPWMLLHSVEAGSASAWLTDRLAMTVAALAAVAGLVVFRQFILQYLGDVAIYVSSNRLNRFCQVRGKIREQCLEMARTVYGATDPSGAQLYENVVVVGHSLGSVIAYDTLNAMINDDLAHDAALSVARRTPAFITLGSPLDTTAFIFKLQTGSDQDIRDGLTGAIQPLIQGYGYRPATWTNIHARLDVIGSALSLYDDDKGNGGVQRISNVREQGWHNPLAAHTGYFGRAAFGKVLGEALCAARIETDRVQKAA